MIILSLLLLNHLDFDLAVWNQHIAYGQDSVENMNNETTNRLDKIIELLEKARLGSIIQLYLTIIVFMMGLAFVIFGLYIGIEVCAKAFFIYQL